MVCGGVKIKQTITVLSHTHYKGTNRFLYVSENGNFESKLSHRSCRSEFRLEIQGYERDWEGGTSIVQASLLLCVPKICILRTSSKQFYNMEFLLLIDSY